MSSQPRNPRTCVTATCARRDSRIGADRPGRPDRSARPDGRANNAVPRGTPSLCSLSLPRAPVLRPRISGANHEPPTASRRQYGWTLKRRSTTMLAEIFMLRLEAQSRANQPNGSTTTASDTRSSLSRCPGADSRAVQPAGSPSAAPPPLVRFGSSACPIPPSSRRRAPDCRSARCRVPPWRAALRACWSRPPSRA